MNTKEVYFSVYCPKCENYDKLGSDEPCNDCLARGWNEDSHKPIRFKEKEEISKVKSSHPKQVP